ncbi:MAG: glycerophosphodiester phosphodiesterase family protein [Reichenbachiella sp.]|uniref:glycerophosphodiester phosphodiesterase family protein n=1 Tax=Reichenbachiella sp. TaxID=2184521 RepID=UPI0032633DB6
MKTKFMKSSLVMGGLMLMQLMAYAQQISVVNCNDPLPAKGYNRVRHIYYCPQKFPNFSMISMHRGYWKDGPENSLNSVDGAIALNRSAKDAPGFVELDIMKGKNGTMFLFHDFKLDRLTTGKGTVKSNYFTVVKSYNEIKNYDLKKEGAVFRGQHIPSLSAALDKIKPTGLMVNIDKGDYFLDDVYDLFIKKGMVDRVISKGYLNPPKGKASARTPALLKRKFPRHGDLIVKSYTPIIVPEDIIGTTDNPKVTKAEIDAWINTPGFPGFEIIYKKPDGPILTDKRFNGMNIVDYVKSRGKRAGIFNEWPDNCQGTWNSPQSKYKTTLATDADRRGDFNFIDKYGADFIVTDRSSLLWQYLKTAGQRSLQRR